EVCQTLGEVAEELPALWVDLLRVEANVVGKPDELVHQAARLVEAALAGERVDEPEGASEERAFLARDAVFAPVAVDERPLPELALDRRDRSPQPLAGRIVVGEDRHRQQACIELAEIGGAHVAAALC